MDKGCFHSQWYEEGFSRKVKEPESMNDEQCEKLYEKTFSSIQLGLFKEVLWEVIRETTAANLWLKLESLQMTKSLANKYSKNVYTYFVCLKVHPSNLILMHTIQL